MAFGTFHRGIRASVVKLRDGSVSFHSAAVTVAPLVLHDLREVLSSWENPSLWRLLHCDGNGSWIYRALYLKTLVIIAHDGSYMPKIATDVCSGACVLYCKATHQRAHCSWVERTSAASADTYRGELLAGVCALLIVKAATHGHVLDPSIRVIFHCNKLGVVFHGNNPRRQLPE
jgi:hypothetical protein